jgi:hypothetical protein
VGVYEEKLLLARHMHGWEDNIKGTSMGGCELVLLG